MVYSLGFSFKCLWFRVLTLRLRVYALGFGV